MDCGRRIVSRDQEGRYRARENMYKGFDGGFDQGRSGRGSEEGVVDDARVVVVAAIGVKER
jgi:hypothetical protein